MLTVAGVCVCECSSRILISLTHSSAAAQRPQFPWTTCCCVIAEGQKATQSVITLEPTPPPINLQQSLFILLACFYATCRHPTKSSAYRQPVGFMTLLQLHFQCSLFGIQIHLFSHSFVLYFSNYYILKKGCKTPLHRTGALLNHCIKSNPLL